MTPLWRWRRPLSWVWWRMVRGVWEPPPLLTQDPTQRLGKGLRLAMRKTPVGVPVALYSALCSSVLLLVTCVHLGAPIVLCCCASVYRVMTASASCLYAYVMYVP